jgi:hypothetical protein
MSVEYLFYAGSMMLGVACGYVVTYRVVGARFGMFPRALSIFFRLTIQHLFSLSIRVFFAAGIAIVLAHFLKNRAIAPADQVPVWIISLLLFATGVVLSDTNSMIKNILPIGLQLKRRQFARIMNSAYGLSLQNMISSTLARFERRVLYELSAKYEDNVINLAFESVKIRLAMSTRRTEFLRVRSASVKLALILRFIGHPSTKRLLSDSQHLLIQIRNGKSISWDGTERRSGMPLEAASESGRQRAEDAVAKEIRNTYKD